MTSKEMLKRVRRFLARFFIMLFYFLFRALPKSMVFGLSKVVLPFFSPFIGRHRRVTIESLSTAFGNEKTAEEIKAISNRCLYNLGENIVEMSYYFGHPLERANNITVEGKEHLDRALEKGKGVVNVTAHFGNFALMMHYLALMGYKVRMILRPLRDHKFDKFVASKMRMAGMEPIYSLPRRKCVQEAIKTLRDNKLLFLLPDQNYGADGHVYVDFFGKQAATATGPVIFASRTGAAILPTFIRGTEDKQHIITILPPYQLKKMQNDEETARYNMAQITKIIEGQIRKYPHEWAWIHRRWKNRPRGEKEIKVKV